MTERLAKSASGARHLRWAQEVVATAKAHATHNYLLSAEQRNQLALEAQTITGYISKLGEHVSAYRNFIETAYIESRANQRVADFLCDDAERQADGQLRPYKSDINASLRDGFSSIFSKKPLSKIVNSGREATVRYAREAASKLRTLPASIAVATPLASALEKAADLLQGFVDEQSKNIDPQRRPLRTAVDGVLSLLREELEKMDGRLRGHFTQNFIESLYPELTKQNTIVADEEDEEDDTTASPQSPS